MRYRNLKFTPIVTQRWGDILTEDECRRIGKHPRDARMTDLQMTGEVSVADMPHIPHDPVVVPMGDGMTCKVLMTYYEWSQFDEWAGIVGYAMSPPTPAAKPASDTRQSPPTDC